MLVTNLSTNLADPSFQPTDREEAMAKKGRDRYLERQDVLVTRGAAADRDDYASVIRRSLLDVANKIDEAVERDRARNGTKRSRVLVKVEGIEAVTVAYITLSTIFNSLHETTDKNKIIAKIGNYLQNERNFHWIEDQAPQAWSRLVRYAKDHGSLRHQTRFILNTAQADGLLIEDWDAEDESLKAKLGDWLIGLCVEAELIDIDLRTVGKRSTSEIVLQDHVVAWLEDYRVKAEAGSLPMITPVLSPLTEPPKDWTSVRNGGYRKLPQTLVKFGSQADYGNADMSKVFRAVNLMQRTAWHVHPGMLELVGRLWADGQKVGKLPLGLQQSMPERVAPEVWEAWTPEVRKGHSLMRKDITDANRQAAGDHVSVNMVLAQARELQDAPAIYMPVQLDYRGRAYCQPLLSPQGADYVRAMLEFAEGKPVGERGAMWLGIQVATLWDGEYRNKKLSKASFQDRYDWTLENEDFLRSVVDDPLGHRDWINADKPFMFLRTAIDWVGFLDEGDTFVSHVPIALDGSCSGVQHYAAILRDEATGARVNLIPTEEPGDIYGDVGDMLAQVIEADDDPLAEFWRGHGISRKLVKKPVMTYGYHSREAGFAKWYKHNFVKPALKTQGSDEPSDPIARYLAKRTMEAVELALPSVAAGMDWLITCANLLAHEGKSMSWTTPSGFPVVQRYVDIPSKRVETMLGGVRLRVSIPGTPSPTINKRKQANAIAPNHTHSLDAAHLMLTVLQADAYGVTSFALIHDSFGTLAADADAMFSATRDAFVDMYTNNDPFQHMYDQVHEALSEKGRSKLPLPPAKGNLDITQVQQSMYAFA